MSSIFTPIINGEIPCYKVAENEHCFAFLDINPVAKGHTLVIPKKEVDYIFDLEEDLFLELQRFSKKIAKAIETVVPCPRIGTTVVGLEVPHAHIHLVPLSNLSFIDFSLPRVKMTKEEMATLAQQIATAFAENQ